MLSFFNHVIYSKPYPTRFIISSIDGHMCQRHVWETLKNSQYVCVLPCGVCPTFVAWLVGMGATQTNSMVNKLLQASKRIGLEIPPCKCAKLAITLAQANANTINISSPGRSHFGKPENVTNFSTCNGGFQAYPLTFGSHFAPYNNV